jgi:hypothetical protein
MHSSPFFSNVIASTSPMHSSSAGDKRSPTFRLIENKGGVGQGGGGGQRIEALAPSHSPRTPALT